MINFFDKPKIIGIIADADEGKSMLIYNMIKELQEAYDFRLFTFGLRLNLKGAERINSIEKLEQITDSVIFLDEFFDLFDLDDRKKKKQIERTLRLIFHNNNILILSGLPDNFKKFISSQIHLFFYKKVTFSSFINGSRAKINCVNYIGEEKGSTVLNLPKSKTISYDRDTKSYDLHHVEYIEQCDTKKKNVPIFVPKNVQKKSENLEVK